MTDVQINAKFKMVLYVQKLENVRKYVGKELLIITTMSAMMGIILMEMDATGLAILKKVLNVLEVVHPHMTLAKVIVINNIIIFRNLWGWFQHGSCLV